MNVKDDIAQRRVTLAVSDAMVRLRKLQNVFNGFWATTELSYGYVLSQADVAFRNRERKTADLLGHIESQVWYPNHQGRIKRDETVGTFLRRVQENTAHVYRATLLSFFSVFEAFLGERVGILVPGTKHWGPFAKTLRIPPLIEAQVPIQLRTVLCADFCRKIRNRIVHEALAVPTMLLDQSVVSWKQELSKIATDSKWPADAVEAEVKYATNQVVGQAVNEIKKAKKEGKELPIELFYMLYTFTNLDTLAIEIEEALQPSGATSGGRVRRKELLVRRKDLIVDCDALKGESDKTSLAEAN